MLDGANPFQIFFKIKVPQIMGTIVVVWTTITIVVLKIFDIVYAMTNGNFGSADAGQATCTTYCSATTGASATAVAFVIMLLVLPIMIWNIRNVRKEMR